VLRLLVTANVVPNPPILVTLMISVLTRATRCNVPEDGSRRHLMLEIVVHGNRGASVFVTAVFSKMVPSMRQRVPK
jgi:hypothetical protein